jgi:hypothetical protein
MADSCATHTTCDSDKAPVLADLLSYCSQARTTQLHRPAHPVAGTIPVGGKVWRACPLRHSHDSRRTGRGRG